MKIEFINCNASRVIDDKYIHNLIDNDVNILKNTVHDSITRIPANELFSTIHHMIFR